MARHFISYSSADAQEFALRLCAELEGGKPPHSVWLDRRDIRPGQDWDEAIAEAVKTCRSLLFVMTPDSVEDCSECKREWSYALRYKKPVIPLKLHPEAETPFRLGTRQHIDFTRAPDDAGGFGSSLASADSDPLTQLRPVRPSPHAQKASSARSVSHVEWPRPRIGNKSHSGRQRSRST